MTLQESAPSRRPRRDRCPHSTPHAGGRQGPERCRHDEWAARSHPAHGRWARPTARPARWGAVDDTASGFRCSGKSKGVTVCTILATTSCAAPGSRRADPAGNHTRGQDDETGGDGRPVARPRAVPRCSLVLGTRGPPPEGCDPSAREHPSARRSQAPAARWSRRAQNAFQRARGERRGPFGEGPDLLEELAHGDEIGRVSFVATGEKLFDSGVVQGLVHPAAGLAPTPHRSAALQTEQRRRWTSPRCRNTLGSAGGVPRAVATLSGLIRLMSRTARTSRWSDVKASPSRRISSTPQSIHRLIFGPGPSRALAVEGLTPQSAHHDLEMGLFCPDIRSAESASGQGSAAGGGPLIERPSSHRGFVSLGSVSLPRWLAP